MQPPLEFHCYCNAISGLLIDLALKGMSFTMKIG